MEFRKRGTILLYAFTIMPDHWHALWTLKVDISLGRAVHDISRWISYPSRQVGNDILRQEGFHDHKVRGDSPITCIVDYIESNPVRARLVDSTSDWPWSSAHPEYSGRLDRAFLGHERWER
jgi:REP element-mobilizing transposase RayT